MSQPRIPETVWPARAAHCVTTQNTRNCTQIKRFWFRSFIFVFIRGTRILRETVIHGWIMRSCVMESRVPCNIPSDDTYVVRELYTSEWETGLEAPVRSYFPHRLHTYGTHLTPTSELYRYCTLIRRGMYWRGRETRRQWNVPYVMISPRYVLRATLVSCGGGSHFSEMQGFHRLTVAACTPASQNWELRFSRRWIERLVLWFVTPFSLVDTPQRLEKYSIAI